MKIIKLNKCNNECPHRSICDGHRGQDTAGSSLLHTNKHFVCTKYGRCITCENITIEGFPVSCGLKKV